MNIGSKNFETSGKTYIMGILNVTPDSFSDGGTHNELDSALKHTERMIYEGADIIDIGGESARPGYTMISDSEEIKRIVPIIKEIKKRFDIPISVDTYKSKVAKAAIYEGADLINDIWGLKYDEEMASIIKKGNVSCCLMHNRKNDTYNNFIEDVLNDLKASVQIALDENIPKEKIILDPGVGFAKSYEQNLEIINKAEALHALNYPLLLGTSRKSVIGLSLDLPSTERLEGTLATSVLAVLKGYMFVRVHDVKENKRAVMMTEKILGR